MGLSIKSAGDLIAVSNLRQTGSPAEGNAATLDKLLLFDEASAIGLVNNRESNQGEKTGHVEPTDVNILDRSTEGTLTQAKATPDGIAWAAAFGFGNHAVTSLGSGVFRHLSQLVSYPSTPSYFTAAHRRGGGPANAAADFRRHVGLGINTLSLSLTKNDFTALGMGILGIGKADDMIRTEIISADDDVTTLTLGFDPKDDDHTNVTVWADVNGDGVYEREVFTTGYTAGSNALAITSLGGGGSPINYRVTYQVEDDETGYTWGNLDALVTAEEFILKAANCQIIPGGQKISSGPISRGTTGQIGLCEILALNWELNWNGSPGRCWRIGSVASEEATQVQLGDPLQTITVNREVRDYLFKQNFDANSPFGIYMDALGPAIPGGGGPVFSVKLMLPRLKFLTDDYEVTDGKWVEAGTLIALKDPANPSNPTVEIEVVNQVATYLV